MDMGAELTCLTRICPSKAERLSSITWNPQILRKENCPNIDGKYSNLGFIKSKNVSVGYVETPTYLKDLIFLSPADGFNIKYESHQKIPGRTVVVNYKDINGKPLGKSVKEDNSDFYKQAIISINLNQDILSLKLLDTVNTTYMTGILDVIHPYIGCHGGKFIVRELHATGGIEGGIGAASAEELILQRLSNGSLEVSRNSRTWQYSNSRGVLNLNNPSKDEYTLVFKPLN